MKRINTRRIKAKASYYLQPLADMLGVHVNTIHRWIEEGLPRIDDAYPYMVYGEELIDFLNARQQSKKIPLQPDEFFCCRCQKARRAWGGLADLIPCTSKTGNLRALCPECGGTLHKLISLQKQPELAKYLEIHPLPYPVLIQSTHNSVNIETKKG
ncbi:MAG TPA: hypothetical protein VFT64_11245 [Rickettsiales bacterium]|nr:hypothetical protein [Rickettsiales bacterium]